VLEISINLSVAFSLELNYLYIMLY
jgi:hypothetical protein